MFVIENTKLVSHTATYFELFIKGNVVIDAMNGNKPKITFGGLYHAIR